MYFRASLGTNYPKKSMPTNAHFLPKKSRNGHEHGWGCPQQFKKKSNILFQHSSRDEVCTSASSSDFTYKSKAACSDELDVDGSKYVP